MGRKARCKYTKSRNKIAEYALEEDKNLAKFKAAEKYCTQNGMDFIIWTEKNLF